MSLVVAASCWATSSPPLATPDERVHIPSIWCSPSSSEVDCKDRNFEGESGVSFGNPSYLPNNCYFRAPTVPANCSELPPFSERVAVLREGTYYLAGFQNVLNALITSDGSASVLRMRLFNALVFVVLLSIVIAAAPWRIASTAVTATAVTVSPFSIWLISSPNPSSWAISGVGLGWLGVLWVATNLRRHRKNNGQVNLPAGVLQATLATGLAASARLDALFMFAAVVLIVVTTEVLMNGSLYMRYVTPISSVVFVALAGVFASRELMSRREALGALRISGASEQPPFWTWLTSWMIHFPTVFLDAFGSAGLGENEIRIPSSVIVLSVLVLGAVVSFASERSSCAQLSSLVVLLFSLASMLWFASFEMDLYNVPGRYVMPLFPVIVGTYIYYSKSTLQLFDILRLRQIAISLLGVANALGLYAVVERYSAGSSAGLRVIPVRFDEWWWDFLPIGPNAVVILGSVSWVVFLVYAFRFLDERKLREAAS